MKAPLSWLQDFVEINVDMDTLTRTMIMHGLGVEGIERVYGAYDSIVIGKLLRIVPHENSDHLQICTVTTGDETLQIVTGAPNVYEGMVCPVAKVGTVMPQGTEIKPAVLRGVPSAGMLCSGKELELTVDDWKTADVDGIMDLGAEMEAHLGEPVYVALGLDDTVIDFEISANRGDCMSVLGVAREIGAALNVPVKTPEVSVEETDELASRYVSVEVREPQLCPRYSARVMTDIVRGDSPRWMQRRLLAAGMRPVNNIVDITNYVMLEVGQPLHAFDYHAVADGKIIVRRAEQGEKMTTLDEKPHVLTDDMLVIADKNGAIALAGVMGGLESEITEKTEMVLLESATFDGPNNRHTSRALGMMSEASARYTKGVGQQTAGLASDRAAQLFVELGVGKVMKGRIDTQTHTPEPRVITARVSRINTLLGTKLTGEEMAACLSREGIKAQLILDTLQCSVPYHREDVVIEEDIAEEIARISGYERIPMEPLSGATQGGLTLMQKQKERLRTLLVDLGLHETMSYAFISPKDFDSLGYSADDPARQCIKINNPLSEDYGYMRTTVVPAMVQALSGNVRNKVQKAKLFEISNVHSTVADADGLPTQKAVACVGVVGSDFMALKGLLEKVFHAFDAEVVYTADGGAQYHPTRKALLSINGTVIGQMGQMHPDVMAENNVDQPVLVAEFDLAPVFACQNQHKKYAELPKYPAMLRDLALVVEKHTQVGPMMQAIRQAGGPQLENVELFDVYVGDQAGFGKKSVAFALTLRDKDRTMTDEEANAIFQNIVEAMEQQFGAKLRGN